MNRYGLGGFDQPDDGVVCCALSGYGLDRTGEVQLHPHSVRFPAYHSCPARSLVVADHQPVAGLRIETAITGAGTLRHPALDNHVRADLVRIVGQVKGGNSVHVQTIPTVVSQSTPDS